MKKTANFLFVTILTLYVSTAYAYIPMGAHGKPNLNHKKSKSTTFVQECAQSKSSIEINVNNIRARLQGGGDLWWDLKGNAAYVVPNVASGVPPVAAIFAGGLWVAGIDGNGNIKTACTLYRGATDNDWWPGPLDDNGTIDAESCSNWDKHFTVYKTEIEAFKIAYQNAPKDGSGKVTDANFKSKIPKNVLGWPAKENPFFESINGFSLGAKRKASFFDKNLDDVYNPFDGDYPNLRYGQICKEPDQIVWWVFNDAGGVHTQSNGQAMRLEVEATSFAFATDDDLNNMTFQDYKITNRSSQNYDSCAVALWLDPDLGCGVDDFIGCDTTTDYMGNQRTMMYVYNEDAVDGKPGSTCAGGINTYGNKPPILGIDIIKRPDDNSKTYFMYFNRGDAGNPAPGTTDPNQGSDFFNYMYARWEDGTPLSIGGNGYTPNPDPKKITRWAFFDDPNNPKGWSMQTSALGFGDRRTLLSVGGFKMQLGEIKSVTYSLPYVSNQGGGAVDLTSLRRASTQARELFNRCFNLFGPSAPDATALAFDQAVVLNLSSSSPSLTNFEDNYKELAYLLPNYATNIYYKFEGYKIYQVVSDNISLKDIENNPSIARLIATTDVTNGVTKVYNWRSQKDPNDASFPNFVNELKAEGNDLGIKRSFFFNKDAFSNNAALQNGKTYHYVVLPYGYNNFGSFDKLTGNGQKNQYVAGFENVKVYSVTPKSPSFNSKYGVELPITRFDGIGAGGNFLDMTDDMYPKFFDKTFDGTIHYKAGRGPVSVIVVDPNKLQDGNYSLRLVDGNMNDQVLNVDAKWQLFKDNDQPITSAKSIERLNEEIIDKYGLLVSIAQQAEPCSIHPFEKQGIIGQEIAYKNTNKQWLKTITDDDESFSYPHKYFDFVKNESGEELFDLDCLKNKNYEKTGNVFIPYAVADYKLRSNGADIIPYTTPAWLNNSNAAYYLKTQTQALKKLSNVDIILTPDKSKWSRCVVVETINSMQTSEGLESEKASNLKGYNLDLRAGKSIGTDTDPDAPSDGTLGKSWFPGYAIDVESGRRLNILFGENSGYNSDNVDLMNAYNINSNQLTGRDMIWNPTADVVLKNTLLPTTPLAADLIAGCGHYIYVMYQNYDGCADLFTSGGTNVFSRNIAKNVAWTGMPYLSSGVNLLSYKDGIIPNECIIKLRVNNPYQIEKGLGTNNSYPSYGFSMNKKTIAVKSLQVEEKETFNLFPNPILLNSNPTITFNNLPQNFELNIFGLDGKLFFSKKCKELDNSTLMISSAELKLSNAGIYLAVIKSEKGIQTKRIVVVSN